MYRREFLRAGGLAGVTAVALTARNDRAQARQQRDGSAPRTETPTTTGTSTTTGTPTPTPTPAVATPSSEFDPLGTVDVEGATETVVTPDGGTAFVATGDGFAAVDVSDPTAPTVDHVEAPVRPGDSDVRMGGIQDVKYDAGHLLVAGPAGYNPESYHGVAWYDVTDPTAPEQRASYRTGFPVHNCFLDGEVGYLAGTGREFDGLVVVDLPGERELARWSPWDHDERWEPVGGSLATIHDVWVHDDVASLAYWDAGTWLVDVSDPGEPTYVANITAESPEQLARLDSIETAGAFLQPPGNDHYVATNTEGTLLAVGKESWDSNFGEDDGTPTGTATPSPDPGGPSGIHLYDVSDRRNPVKRAEIPPPPTADAFRNGVWTTAHNFDIHDGYLYSSWYRGGVRVHDVSDPANPEEISHFRRSRTSSFWTAQLVRAGESLVATSRVNPQRPDESGTLYVFPDPREVTTTPTSTPTPTPTRSPTETTTRNGATTPPTSTASTTSDTSVGDGGPGFGPLAALAGLGVAGWRLLSANTGVESAETEN